MREFRYLYKNVWHRYREVKKKKKGAGLRKWIDKIICSIRLASKTITQRFLDFHEEIGLWELLAKG